MAAEQKEGFLELFDAEGTRVDFLPREFLGTLEARDRDESLFTYFEGREGYYWLISNRPGLIAALVDIHVYYLGEDFIGGPGWRISYGLTGTANYEGWDREYALEFYRQPSGSRTGCPPLPDNVYQLALEHVAYRRALDPAASAEAVFWTRDEKAMTEQLARLLDGVDASELVTAMADRQVQLLELLMMVVEFCAEANLGSEFIGPIISAILPEEQHEAASALLEEWDDQSED